MNGTANGSNSQGKATSQITNWQQRINNQEKANTDTDSLRRSRSAEGLPSSKKRTGGAENQTTQTQVPLTTRESDSQREKRRRPFNPGLTDERGRSWTRTNVQQENSTITTSTTFIKEPKKKQKESEEPVNTETITTEETQKKETKEKLELTREVIEAMKKEAEKDAMWYLQSRCSLFFLDGYHYLIGLNPTKYPQMHEVWSERRDRDNTIFKAITMLMMAPVFMFTLMYHIVSEENKNKLSSVTVPIWTFFAIGIPLVLVLQSWILHQITLSKVRKTQEYQDYINQNSTDKVKTD